MTNPEEVVVSDEDVQNLILWMHGKNFIPSTGHMKRARKALATLIAKRVPDDFSSRAMEEGAKSNSPAFNGAYMLGFNACRERVLKWE